MTNPNEDKTVDATSYNRHLMNNVVRLPMVVNHAFEGTLHTQEGMLADFWGDEGVCALGYNTPPVIGAILGFMATHAPHQLPDVYPHPYRWQAAEVLCNRTGMDKVFFANSGTEANESAIKLARKYWWDQEPNDRRDLHVGRRHTILTVKGNFHGRTGNSLAAGDCRVSPYHRHGFGPGAQGYGVLDWEADFNQVRFQQAVFNGLEYTPRIPEWDKVAAIILAPVLGNNVVTTYKPAFWSELERIRDEHGVLLIFDDIQAGSGRAGWCATWQHPDCGVKPDIMTLAKGMAMGFPMSAMLARERIAASLTPGVHFNTFGGSPFMCWMAVKMIEWLDDNLEQVRATGEYIREWFRVNGWISEYDGWGMLNAFTPNWERFKYNGYDFIHEARNHGLSLVTHRPFGPIRFTPRLNIERKELDVALGALWDTHVVLRKQAERLDRC